VNLVEQTLPIGDYLCTLEIDSTNAINPPQYLNVLLDVAISNGLASVSLGDLEQVYDGTLRVATATTEPQGRTVSFTYDGNPSAPTDAGSYAVVATVTDPGWLGSATGTLVVAQAPQTITFPALADQVVTGQVALAATASSGLDVAFEVVDGPAELSAGVLSFSGTGTVTVVARQSGNANWEAALDVTNAFAVTKVLAMVQLQALEQVYDGTARTVTATSDPAGLPVQITYDGQATAPVAAGTYAVTATINHEAYSGMATGLLVVARAIPTVSVWPVAANDITYGQTLADAGLDVSGAQSSVPGTYSYDNSDVEPEVGSYSAAVTFTPTDAENYEPAAGMVTVTVESAVNYFTTEYHSLSNNQVPANWELVVNESSVQLENGRLVAKPTNANGYLLREGVMPDDTTTLTCSWKGNLEYSEWGMCSGLRLTHGETVVIIRAMTADYNFGDQTHISMTLTGTNGAATFFEELIPLQFGEYDFQVTIENGIILFESHLIDGDPYFSVISPIPSEAEFSLQNVNKIDFGVHTTTDNDNWLNDISILLEDGEIGSKVWRWPVATNAITYGQTLVEAGLDDSEALSSVPGTYAYDNPGFVPNAGSIAAPVTFTPMDTLYESVSGTVMVTVNLATPTVSVWPVAANAITYGQTLADAGLDVADAQSSVPGTYAYDAPDVVPEIGSYSAAVTFRPTDNANYTMAAGTVAVTVNPDVPDTVWFDVFSAHGVSHPTTGRHEIAYGTLITNVLEAGIADEGLTRYVANGFDLQNGEVLASSATSAVVRLTNNTSLTWQWLTEHWLAVGASFHGTVDTGSGWQAEGSIITLTAQPSAYYDFDRWLGVAAAQRMDNPLQLEMDAPHSIQAIFKERLTSNGTPEWWLAQQGWTNDFEAAAADDPDGDGSPTWEEQLAGTDPNDPASFFRFEGLAFSATHIGLYWPSIAGREYQIEYSTNLTQAAWNLFPNGEQIAADPPENQRDIVVTNLPERHRMFRVSVRLATNEVSHEVAYVAGPNGAVSGATFQELGSGEIGQMVWAVPDDGYEFVQWSDGSTDNPRTDMDVDAAQVLTAEFAPTGASPPEGQAIEAVSVEAPVVRTYADTTTIAVEASRNCYGTVEILRTAVSVTPIGVIQYVPGEVVRRLETPLMAGRNQVHWDGLNDSGRGCSNGLYQFRILATNAVGEAYQSYSPASTTNTVSVEASGLSPTTPRFRANEPCRMSYTLGSPAAMAVFVEQGDTTWDSWVQFREAGSHIDDWSGRHSTDGQLLDGGFALTALARELPENALVLDRQLLTDVEAEIYAIRPVYDQVTTIHYTLAAEADVWVELENPSGTTALLGVADGLEAGPHSFVWDGKVSNTAIFSEAGDYTLRIAAASEELDVEQNVFLNVMGF
jgi:flagellar hook assembly protein FlgD